MVVAGECRAQGQGSSVPPRGGMGQGRGRMEGEFRPMRERMSELSPEDRQRFEKNAQRWMQMSPAERSMLRERENIRRERVRREADEALRGSGLTLDAAKREQFQIRYMQERRKVEQALHKEIEEKRQQQLAPVIERLKKEFQSQQASPAATAAATVSASPGK